jgi:hypothetical protein
MVFAVQSNHASGMVGLGHLGAGADRVAGERVGTCGICLGAAGSIVAHRACPVRRFLWNHRLDRVQPLGPRGLLDWGMFVAAMVASIGVAALERGGSSIPLALALALVLAPLSVIQVRATRKSFAAHQRAREHVTLISDRVVERAGSRTAA